MDAFFNDFLFSEKTTTLLMDYSFSLIFCCGWLFFKAFWLIFLLPEGSQMTQESVANRLKSAAAILKASKEDNKASSL